MTAPALMQALAQARRNICEMSDNAPTSRDAHMMNHGLLLLQTASPYDPVSHLLRTQWTIHHLASAEEIHIAIDAAITPPPIGDNLAAAQRTANDRVYEQLLGLTPGALAPGMPPIASDTSFPPVEAPAPQAAPAPAPQPAPAPPAPMPHIDEYLPADASPFADLGPMPAWDAQPQPPAPPHAPPQPMAPHVPTMVPPQPAPPRAPSPFTEAHDRICQAFLSAQHMGALVAMSQHYSAEALTMPTSDQQSAGDCYQWCRDRLEGAA